MGSTAGAGVVGALIALSLHSCIVTEEHREAGEDPVIRSSQAARMWEVVADGVVIGSVVLFESKADSFFSVRNEWHQDVGMIDSMGRAWAFEPHEEEAKWLGSGSIATGAGQILEAAGEVVIREVGLKGQLPVGDGA